MTPDIATTAGEVTRTSETALLSPKILQNNVSKQSEKNRNEIVWPILILHAYINLAGLYGAYLMLTSAKILTGVWAFVLFEACMLGMTAGTHRLWCHRSYKAKWPLKVICMLLHTMAFQDTVYDWARNHRMHHKHSDTDADPHNAHRGLFFSHYGWVLVRKHPAVKEEGKKLDFSDLDADKLLLFQKRYYAILMPVLCFLIPCAVPVYLWGETWSNAYYIAGMMRIIIIMHSVMFINSVTHLPSRRTNKPYDKNIVAAESFMISLLTLGEGWHNFHHVFPWDYKASERGNNRINPTTHFIDFCARFGWAYDLKTVPVSVLKKRIERTGDGSHEIWGWGDRDMTAKDKNLTEIINKKVL